MEGVLVLLFLALLVVFLVTRKAAIKAFSKSYELPPAQDIHEQEADEALKYAGTPDKPYVQELTAEEKAHKEWLEATRLRAGLKADGSKPDWIGKSAPSDDKPIEKRGPRGGRYTEDRTKDGRPYRRYF